jgi:DNA-binding response OmpR family regulator
MWMKTPSLCGQALRDKLEENARQARNYIKTVYGVGYIWAVS